MKLWTTKDHIKFLCKFISTALKRYWNSEIIANNATGSFVDEYLNKIESEIAKQMHAIVS